MTESLTENCRRCSNYHDLMAATGSKFACDCRCHYRKEVTPWVYDRNTIKQVRAP